MAPSSEQLTPASPELAFYARYAALEPANRWRRLGTFVIDALVLQLCIYGFFVLEAAFAPLSGDSLWRELARAHVGVCLLLIYYVVMESRWGRTPGKWIMGTAVVREDGGSPSVLQILGRSVCRLLPYEELTIFRNERLTWHDSVSRTTVIRKPRRARPD